jgi:hypothetical protein
MVITARSAKLEASIAITIIPHNETQLRRDTHTHDDPRPRDAG